MAGQPFETRLAVESPVDGVDRPAQLAVQVCVHRRVDVAGTGSHHQAFKRGEPHRCVDRQPAADGSGRRAVAEVEDDQVDLVDRLAQEACRLPAHEGLRRPVESVAADPVLLVPLQGNGVGIGDGRHGLVERGVEHRYLRHVGEDLAGDPHPLEVGRVVQRCKGHQLAHLLDERVVDESGLSEAGTAVDDTMANRSHLGLLQRGPMNPERVEHGLERLLDRGELALGRVPGAARRMVKFSASLTDLLHRPGRRGRAGLGVDKAVLQRRRPRVENQDVGAHERLCAWMAVIAMVFTMSRTVAPRERSLTGLRSP